MKGRIIHSSQLTNKTVSISERWPDHTCLPVPPPIATASHWQYAEPGCTYDFGSGPVPYPIGPDGPYTHYIDPNHPSGTNSSNPYGTHNQPRLTIPSPFTPVAAGAVMEMHGTITGTTISVSGTADKPIFVRGNSSTRVIQKALGGINLDTTSYLIIENIDFDWDEGGNKRINCADISGGVTDICIRNCSFYNGLPAPPSSIQCVRFKNNDTSHLIKNIVIWDCEFRDMGRDRFTQTVDDVVSISFDANVDGAWVVDNTFDVIGGDGVQIAYDSYISGITQIPQQIYVVGNQCSNTFENFIDLKTCKDILVAHNETWNSSGTGYRFNLGDVTAETRKNIWSINNKLHNSYIVNGGFIMSQLSTHPKNDGYWCIGNEVIDCGRGIGFFTANTKNAHILNNKVVNSASQAAFYVFGDITSVSGEESPIEIRNNAVYNLLEYSGESRSLWTGGTSGQLDLYGVSHNLWHSGTYKYAVFDNSVKTTDVELDTLADLEAQHSGWSANSSDIDPRLNDIDSPSRLAGNKSPLHTAIKEFELQFPTAKPFSASPNIGSV